jgi:hypothetical protein
MTISLNDPITTLIIGLFVVLLGWYWLGTMLNRRRVMRILRVIEGGAPEMGTRFQLPWRSSAGVQINFLEPVAPYIKANIVVSLEARDILPVWLFDHFFKGKRDQVVLRAEFARPPVSELVVLDPKTALGRLSLDHARSQGGSIEQATGPRGRRLGYSAQSKTLQKPGEDLARLILQQDWPVWVVSYQTHSPHLIVVWGVSETNREMIPPLFRRVRRVAQDVLKEGQQETAANKKR